MGADDATGRPTVYDLLRETYGKAHAFVGAMHDAYRVLESLFFFIDTERFGPEIEKILPAQARIRSSVGLPVGDYDALIGELRRLESEGVPYVSEIREQIEQGKAKLDEVVQEEKSKP